MFKSKTYLLIGFILVCSAILMIFYSYEGKKKEVIEDTPAAPEQGIEKFSVTETEGGNPHWILDAAYAQILEKEKKILLQSPIIKFFENGKYVSTLTASKGRVNTENYDIWGDGECTLDTIKGDKLKTSDLYYNAAAKIISTDKKVKFIRANETIYGEGMETTPDLETIKIKKQRVELNEVKKDK